MSDDNVFNIIAGNNIHERKFIAAVLLNLRLISIEKTRLQDLLGFNNIPSLVDMKKVNKLQNDANTNSYNNILDK